MGIDPDYVRRREPVNSTQSGNGKLAVNAAAAAAGSDDRRRLD